LFDPIFQSGLLGRIVWALCLDRFILMFLPDLHLFRRIGYDDALMRERTQEAFTSSNIVTSPGPDSSPQARNDNRAETSPGHHLGNPCLNGEIQVTSA
jgi:hypothetical protein